MFKIYFTKALRLNFAIFCPAQNWKNCHLEGGLLVPLLSKLDRPFQDSLEIRHSKCKPKAAISNNYNETWRRNWGFLRYTLYDGNLLQMWEEWLRANARVLEERQNQHNLHIGSVLPRYLIEDGWGIDRLLLDGFDPVDITYWDLFQDANVRSSILGLSFLSDTFIPQIIHSLEWSWMQCNHPLWRAFFSSELRDSLTQSLVKRSDWRKWKSKTIQQTGQENRA